jgi:hypothetical protein
VDESRLLGKDKITRQELALIGTPEPTDTFKPIPHHTLVEALAETLSFRHINVTSDEYVVSPDGMKMFGLLQLDATFLDCRFSIGIRNAHDKSMRLGLVAGYNVLVCSNMSFNGEFKPVLAKHSKHFNPRRRADYRSRQDSEELETDAARAGTTAHN